MVHFFTAALYLFSMFCFFFLHPIYGTQYIYVQIDLESSSEHSNDDSDSDDKNGDPNKPSSDFPFEVDPDDHCESPLEAYEDIAPLLQSYGRRIHSGKESSKQLSIYDPYFCNGRVARQLESLGFPEIYNRKEDCYEVWRDSSRYPSYEVFLTNPPYSADHIEKLMQHVTSKNNQNKPWMLLMPNFVHKKDYFQKLTATAGQLPIYLVPKKRYIYLVSSTVLYTTIAGGQQCPTVLSY